jgi:hypothetical protein
MFKRHKLIKILSTLILIFSVLIISAWAINRYIYDLNHYFYLKKCEGKEIGVNGRNDKNYKLDEPLDLKRITNDLRENPNYQIESGSDDYYLGISRNFDDKHYYIRLTNNTADKITRIMVTSKGDLCTEPDYAIELRFDEMVNGLPLTDSQKQNIKNRVEARGYGGSFIGS